MTNDEHRLLIGSVNRALKWPLPDGLRSISADLNGRELTLQFVHDGELRSVEREVIDRIATNVAGRMDGYRVDATLMRVDAPGAYAERLLPVVVLAMFEQEE